MDAPNSFTIINAIINNGLTLVQKQLTPALKTIESMSKIRESYELHFDRKGYTTEEFIEDVYVSMSGIIKKVRLSTDGLRRVVTISNTHGIQQTGGNISIEDFFIELAKKRSGAIVYLTKLHRFLRNALATSRNEVSEEFVVKMFDILDDILLVVDELVIQNDLEYTRVCNIKQRFEIILDDLWMEGNGKGEEGGFDDFDDFDDFDEYDDLE